MQNDVIGLLAPYIYRYWLHASGLLLVTDRNKNSSTLLNGTMKNVMFLVAN